MKFAVLILMAFLFVFTPSGVAESKPQVVVVANSVDYALASDFLEFLRSNFSVVYSDASTFGSRKSKSFIVILGGPDAYEGVGDIVREKLSAEEQKYVRGLGNRKMYALSNLWMQNQSVFIIAGSDRNQTKKAGEENKEAVAQKILGAAVTPEANVSLEGGVSIYAGEVGSPFSYWGFEKRGSYMTINVKSTISIDVGGVATVTNIPGATNCRDTDSSNPISNSPPDATYAQYSTGNTIGWKLNGTNPDKYWVTKDGVNYTSLTSWTVCDNLAVPVATSTVGTFAYTIYYKNTTDNTSNFGTPDSVTITITSTLTISEVIQFPMMTYTFEKLPARIMVDNLLYDVLYVDNAKIIVKRVYE